MRFSVIDIECTGGTWGAEKIIDVAVFVMEDGEIVMTGTKTIIYRYQWDAEKGKLLKKAVESKEEDERLELPEVEDAE